MAVVKFGVVKLDEVASLIGCVTSPLVPMYHWKVGAVPDAADVRVVVLLKLTVTGPG